ncbi:MAG: WGR domain-containing protein, partial [Hamadaea sp.]|nr:WGR domain-containing protein [Hamadaea sp.]
MSIERKLTYVGGGSEKFWQVSQDGCDLHIRYGRIGTTGTTQVKSYGSDDAAQTAADKLVAEKVRKGYVEDTSAGAQAPPAASAPVEAAPVEVLDEDMFTMPATWLRALHPRRGGAQVTAKLPDKDAPEKVAATIEEHREMIVSSLELTTDPEIVEAGTAYLSGQASPLGAAVIAEVMGAYVGWGTSSVFTDLAEAWLVEHGPEFAALAVAELSSLHCGDNYHHTREGMPIRRLTPADEAGPWWRWTRVVLPARVRAALVAVTDTEYADIVAALATCRDRGPRHRAATSFLVPTETAWVEADCAEAAAFLPGLADCLISAVNAPEQAALLAEHVYVWQAASSLALPATVVDGLGTAAVPLLAGWLDGAQAGDPERRVLSVLAELPCDEAMRVMIDRIDRKHTQPALLKAASRFPRRAMRLLAASGGKIAGELLRAHVLAHPDLVDEVLAQTADEAATRRITAISTAAAVTFAPPEALPQVLVSPPWTRRRAVQKATVVEGLACADETAVVWSPQERDLWSKKPSTYRRDSWDQIAARMTEGRHHWSDAKDMFVGGPDAVVRPLLKTYRPTDMWWVSGWLRPTLARFELDALPLAIVCARRQPTQLASALLPFASPEIAVLMAEWLARLKSVRATALSWFARHPDAAARALVPPALGKP